MDFSATVQVRGVKWAVGLAVLLLVAMGVVAGESDEAEPVRVIWMMQGKTAMDLSFLRSPTSDAVQVVWGEEPDESWTDAHFLPNSTCTEGRNYLLQHALAMEEASGRDYDYFVFTEDDAELEEILEFGLNTGLAPSPVGLARMRFLAL